MKEFDLETSRTRYAWLLVIALALSLLFAIGCSRKSMLEEAHGFSNLVLDKGTLWFGAGYKLYRVDLDQQIATILYDTNDVVISFVQIDGKRLFFGGHHSPSGGEGVIWSLDLDNESIAWRQEFKDNWWRGRIATTSLIDEEMIIVGTRTALYGIDKARGDVKWKIEDNWFGTGELLTPILADGQLFYGIANEYFGGDESVSDRTIAIADPSSGMTLKTISMPGKLGAIPTVHGDCLFIKDYQYYRRDNTNKLHWIGELRLNCLDLSSGTIIWSFQGNGVPAPSQISFYNGMVLDVFANRLYAIDEQSGVLHWQSPSLEAASRNPQVIEDLGVIALEVPTSKKVIFLDVATGEPRGKTLHTVLSSPVFVDREAIYGTTNAIVRIDTSTGNVIWSIPVDSKYQVFADED